MKVLRPSSHRRDATCRCRDKGIRVSTLVTTNRKLTAALRRGYSEQGFTLAIALGMGLVMILVAATLLVTSQQDQVIAVARNRTGKSLAVAEGGMARTLTQLAKPNNAVLLKLAYDSINPHTGKTYLGPDGILNNGDGESTAVNQWTSPPASSASCTSGTSLSPPDVSYSGEIGTSGQYTLKAYRYNSTSNTGTLLVEGQQGTSTSLIEVTVSIDSKLNDFPGVLTIENETMALGGRQVLGKNGNVYYDPDLSADPSKTGSSAPSDSTTTRNEYLNAIGSSQVDGKIVACKLTPTLSSSPPPGTPYLPDPTDPTLDITDDLQISGTSGRITYYQTNQIIIEDQTINVDTTNGPVYLYVNHEIDLKGNSKIINIRTDGLPPRVGDLRIIFSSTASTAHTHVAGKSCIQNAFLYSPGAELRMESTDYGCSTNVQPNINIYGVAWAKKITGTTDSTAGIAVPDDLSGLSDIVDSIGLPTINKFGLVQSWQPQKF